jgi:HlyD family secretion protein
MTSRKRILVLIVLLVLGIAGVLLYRSFHSGRSRNPGELVLYGNIDLREVQLAFHDTGRILTLLHQEGDTVKTGELMALMDPVRYEDAVKADRAALAKARVERTDAERTYRRVVRLARVDFNSRQKLDDAEAALDGARAAVDQAKANLAFDLRQLDDTRLYAPVDGIVQNRIMEPGDMGFPQSPVYTIARTHPLWARVYVEEPELGKVREGLSATITSDSFPGRRYAGRIGYISPVAEFTPKEVQTLHQRTVLVYRVRVYLDCPTTDLRLGMPVTATIHLSSNPSAPRSPCPDPNQEKAAGGH